MCGFVGLLRLQGLSENDPARVRTAADMLAHRGPDSSGFYSDTHIALGFRRLKIIDLSPAAEQPMCNENKSIYVVFNGEIYNFRELREELSGQGHFFKSKSDTEVLLHLYEQHGEEMLPKLRGMFAFALWDAPKQRLLLARDPLGVKPLYFAERPGFIAFASEPKALFVLGVKPELDAVALNEALTYRYVPAPRSGFKDVEKLPPGNVAIFERENGNENGALQYRHWWKIPGRIDGSFTSTRQDRALEQTTRHIQNAVSRRLVADVRLGAWLSGGIDSGLIAVTMDEAGNSPHTFCAGFAAPEYDERALARATAQRLRSNASEHSDFEIPPDVFRLLPQIIWHADEPYFDSSCLPTFVLAEKTKPHATVVLSGDGGDEAFGGYDRYIGMGLLERYKRTPALFRRMALAYARWRYPAASRQGWDRMLRWLEKCRLMELSGHHPYLAAMELFSEEQKQAMYGEELLQQIEGCDAREHLSNTLLRMQNSLAESTGKAVSALASGVLQRADLETYLPGDVLHKVDRMSMAHGLEVRSPFLDVELLEFALSLPDNVRLPERRTKPLLRLAARDRLPPEVSAARKRGFGVPLDDWFRGALQTQALEIFESSELVAAGLFKPRYWERLWHEHRQMTAQHGERLYALVSLELWYRMFITGPVPQNRPAPLNG